MTRFVPNSSSRPLVICHPRNSGRSWRAEIQAHETAKATHMLKGRPAEHERTMACKARMKEDLAMRAQDRGHVGAFR
eukprot:6208869-Pleurochrysis_carterae.AAC.5